jgi:hypothetical protein
MLHCTRLGLYSTVKVGLYRGKFARMPLPRSFQTNTCVSHKVLAQNKHAWPLHSGRSQTKDKHTKLVCYGLRFPEAKFIAP